MAPTARTKAATELAELMPAAEADLVVEGAEVGAMGDLTAPEVMVLEGEAGWKC